MGSELSGELACLAAALCWSVAVVWFRTSIRQHGAPLVNLAKNVLAVVLLLGTLLGLGQGRALLGAAPRELLLAAASGLVGMALGDTALFAAVARIGAHRTLLFQPTVPVFAALLAFLFTGERLGARDAVGSAVVLAGIVLVVLTAPEQRAAASRVWGVGGGLALLAALSQSTGIVVAKEALDGLGILPVAVVRLSAASLGLMVGIGLSGRGARLVALAGSGRALLGIAGPAVLGTYVAMLFMMSGLAWAPASIAAVLLSTTPVLGLFVEARVDRRPVTAAGLTGTLVAVAGVAILTGAV